jgi:heme/copper-type cytochrome/quinol oxidase subunit 3
LYHNNAIQANQGLFSTVLLGLYFTALQTYEYFEVSFAIEDSAYGSTYFVATGFHGPHVIIETTFLTMCLLRHTTLHFLSNHQFGFEAAA